MAKYEQLKDGRYRTRVLIGHTPYGKKQYKALYDRDPKKLQQKEIELRSMLSKGIDIMTLQDSFAAWRDRLKAVKETQLEPSEVSLWEHRTQAFADTFGAEPLKDVTQTAIQPVINRLAKWNPTTGKPTAKRTLERYITACSQVFEYAIENRATDFNPCRYVLVPKSAQVHERRALSDEERFRVEEFEHRAQPAAMLMMYSGLRRGEAMALLWSDIDFQNNTISVTKSYDFKEQRIKAPKTESSVRLVSIPQKLTDYLQTLPRVSPYVLTTANKKILTNNAWIALWDSYMCDYNIKYGSPETQKRSKFHPEGQLVTVEPFTPHCLRHTFATLMYFSGVDVLTCQRQMGHADVKTTLGIYTHLDALCKQNNIASLNDYLTPKKKAGGAAGGAK